MLSKIDKRNAKLVARQQVSERIVTKAKAKRAAKKWINESLRITVFEKEIIDFWREVNRQIDKI